MNDYQVYNVALYLRLSREDELAGQSESIQNQRDFLTRHVLEKGWNICDVYIDDGFSGLNYDRPDFQRMLADIEQKKINLVITKDLSRLGRDYIDTGYYLERYFPTQKVRYIALNDNIDTMQDTGNNDLSPFKAVINDMYAKDISKKIRTSFDVKRHKGEFIGAFAPYGYAKDPNDKNKLIIDDVASEVVKRIFSLYIGGESMGAIVRRFNDEGLPCPTKHKNKTTTYKNAMIKRYIWTQETIKRILTNPSYIGNMAQRRQEKINYKLEKYRKIPPNEWIIAEGTHEPLIDKSDFDFVQELIAKKIVHYSKSEKTEHLLNGLLFCQDCGAKLTYRRNTQKKMIAICMTYSKFGVTQCSNHAIQETKVEEYVFNHLRETAKVALSSDFGDKFNDLKIAPDENKKEPITQRLAEIKGIIKDLYTDKLKGIIDEELFVEMSGQFSSEKIRLSKRLAEIEAESITPINYDYKSLIRSIANFEVIDRVILVKLINRIEISENKEIFIFYNFPNPIKTA
ncbi:MAG: recombinase family protein [Defluviitaleaceae bacterium]|nr:recombinase family protein [Defluviitaleaceae bacterium]